jgi:hypothetical protein
MSTTPQGCDTCNKSVLSVLLLRPSPISLDTKLAPIGADKLKNADSYAQGLLPSRRPTQSRFVLRLLRAGYVHVYIPSPPPGMKQWLLYRVTDGADLIVQTDPVFSQMPTPAACSRNGHNAAGMKLLAIPQAHKISSIWIAYSANIWNDSLRAKNAANPDVMQQISLSSCGVNSFSPTADALKAQVLECAVGSIKVALPSASAGSTLQDQDFPFVPMMAEVDNLTRNLQHAAACHPKTKGHEMAVVLRDTVGIAAELNALRLRRQVLAQQDIAKARAEPQNLHPLQSSEALLALRQFLVEGDLEKAKKRAKTNVMTKAQFDTLEGMMGGPATPDGRPYWVALDDAESIKTYGPGKGMRMVPGHEDDLEEWARKSAKLTWEKFQDKYYDEPARQKKVSEIERRLQTEFGDKVIAWEDDWWGIRTDKQFSSYFEHHFDESDPNNPNALHSPGLAYTAEVSVSLTPGPMVSGNVLDAYAKEVMKSPSDPTALLWRAMVANQKELFPSLQAVADTRISASGTFAASQEDVYKSASENASVKENGIAALVKLNGDRFDKLYDFGKNIISLSLDAKNPNVAQKALKKYSWMVGFWGDKMGLYSLSVWMSVGAVAGAVSALRAAQWGAKTDMGKKLIDRALNLALVQRTIDRAQQAVKSGGALSIPMLIGVSYPYDEAKAHLMQRGGVSKRRIRRSNVRGMVTVYILIDSADLAAHNGKLDAAISQGAGQIALGNTGDLRAASGKLPGAITRETFEALWKTGKTIAQSSEAWFGTLDGRLAFGGLLVNIFAIKKSLGDIFTEQTGTAEEITRKNTGNWLGLLDAFGGTMGAGLEMYQVLAKESVVRGAQQAALSKGAAADAAVKAAEAAVKSSVPLARLRVGGALFGVIGGVFATVGDFRKAQDAKTFGQDDVALIYLGATIAFSGTLATSGLTGYGAVAEVLLKSRARGATAQAMVDLAGEKALQRAATRFGVEAGAELLGLSVPGIGWICLGVGLGFEVWATMNTPTALQLWVSRSYFGKSTGTDSEHAKFPQPNWAVELAELQKLFAPAKAEAATQ